MARKQRRISDHIRIAVVLVLFSFFPVLLFFAFYYQSARPQWERGAYLEYHQSMTQLTDAYTKTMEELSQKTAFLANHTTLQAALKQVDTYTITESLEFIEELDHLVKAVTSDNPKIEIRFYPDRCTYNLGNHCRSRQQMEADYAGREQILTQLRQMGSHASQWLVSREEDNIYLTLCTRMTQIDNVGGFLELSVPQESIFQMIGDSPENAAMYLTASADSALEEGILLFSGAAFAPEGAQRLFLPIPELDMGISCLIPGNTVRLEVLRNAAPLFAFSVLLLAGMFLASVLTSKFFTRRISQVLSDIQKKMDLVLENGEIDGADQSEFRQLEDKIYRLIQQTKEHYAKNLQYKEEKKSIELELLQMRFKPHFLYNTLNTIRYQAKSPKIRETVDSLVHYYRIVLSKGMLIIRIQDEIALIEEYLRLEKFSYSLEDFYWHIHVDEQLKECAVIKHILQPIVENALFHGIRSGQGGGEIFISAEKEGEDCLFTIRDTGMGMSQEQVRALMRGIATQKMDSYGIINVQQRVQLYYGEQYGLHIESEQGQGTVVTLRIPAIAYGQMEEEKEELPYTD